MPVPTQTTTILNNSEAGNTIQSTAQTATAIPQTQNPTITPQQASYIQLLQAHSRNNTQPIAPLIMRRINTSTVRRLTRGVALNRIKRLTTRKVGQIEEFLQRCRETQDTSLSFISDNELIKIATEKLPAIIKDQSIFSTYTTFE